MKWNPDVLKNKMKNVKTILLSILCLVCAMAFVGCQDGTADHGNGTDEETTATAPQSEVILIQGGQVNLQIVYAKDATEVASRAMELFAAKFKSKFGLVLDEPIVWENAVKGKPCVVFGKVEKDVSRSLFEKVRNRDYEVAVGDSNIYIAALSEDSYNQAVNALISRLSNLAENDLLRVPASFTLSQTGRYSLNAATVNGIDLKNFVILKPTDSNITETVLNTLSKNIETSYGYALPIKVRGGEGTPTISLVIDESVELMHYGFRVQDGNLTVTAGGVYSMYRATQEIISLLRPDATKTEIKLADGDQRTVSLLNNPDGLARANNSNLRIMSCNAMANGFDEAFAGWSDTGEVTFEMRTEIFEAFLKTYAPDVIGCQEFCPSWYRFFETAYADSEWKISNGSTQGSRKYFLNPILYRADKYRLVEEGFHNYSSSFSQGWGGRYMGWAVFETLTDGQRFVVVNCHWDGWSNHEKNAVQVQEMLAKVKALKAQYNCQVLVTGDFNTRDIDPAKNIPDPDYTTIIEDGTLKDGKYYTEKLVADIGSLHGWGADAYARVYSFDHIFCTTDTVIRLFSTTWDNHQQYASDHAWLIADVDLSTQKSS